MGIDKEDLFLKALSELQEQNRRLVDALERQGIDLSSPANPPLPIIETQADFRDYLANERGRRASTANDYCRDVRRFARYVTSLKDRPAVTSDLTADHFCGYVGSLRKTHNTETTVARAAHGLRAYWGFLYRRKLARRAPSLQELDLEFKRHRRHQRFLNKQEFLKLCEPNAILFK
jgi:site-specific recombinase XerD